MRILRNIFFIIVLFAATEKVTAQDTIIEEPQVETITEEGSSANNEEGATTTTPEHKYVRHYMDENALEALRAKKAFKYEDLENDTLKLNTNKNNDVEESPSRGDFVGFDGSVLLWLLVAVAVIVLVLQLMGLNMRQLVIRNKKSESSSSDIVFENIHQIPYEAAINDAIAKGDFSLATRLMYLQGLKLLSDKNLISWHENKTNWQYVYELNNTNLRNAFRSITSIFEYVHYGHMDVTADKFVLIQDAFSKFKMHVV